jgi:hypothetical protein
MNRPLNPHLQQTNVGSCVFASDKVKKRYLFLVKKLGFNPFDYGFKFDWIVNHKAISMSKQIGQDKILFDFNSRAKKAWSLLSRNCYDNKILKNDRLPTKEEFEKALSLHKC